MAAEVAEIFHDGRFEDRITVNLRRLRDDEGEARAIVESWLASNGWDRGRWGERWSIRKDGQEVFYAA